MAVKGEFGSEKQSSNSKDAPGLQSRADPNGAENIDSMVSSFLAELTDLSSEMNRGDTAAGERGRKRGANDITLPPHFKLQEQILSKSDPDMERYDAEIEESITELENLKSQRDSKTEAPAPHAPSETGHPADELLPATPGPSEKAALPDTVDQDWNRLELFRSGIASQFPVQRRAIGAWKIIAIVLLLIAVGVLIFYLFNLDRASPDGTKTESGLSQAPAQESVEAGSEKILAPPSPESKDKIPPAAIRIVEKNPVAAGDKGKSKKEPRIEVSGSETTGSQNKRAESLGSGPIPELAPLDSSRQVAGPAKSDPEVPSLPALSEADSHKPSSLPAIKENPASSEAPTDTRVLASGSEPGGNKASPESNGQLRPRIALMAEILTRVPPEYPILARKQKVSGVVEVETEINEKGDVVRSKAISGPPLLRGAAEQALKKWKFKPASIGGENVPSKAKISVSFTLQ